MAAALRQAGHVFPDEKIESYNDAIGCVLNACAPDPARRNVLVAHQFVAGAAVCESEEPSVGGVDSIDVFLFEGFDYVALGHLHSPQKVGRDTVRYAGSPLKYSFSEAHQHKAALFVTLSEKGSVRFEAVPLTPRHDLRELRGSYMELTDRRAYDGTPTDDYLHITLTDEQDVPDAAARAESKTPLEHFAAFYEAQNGQPLSDEQAAFCRSLIEDIWKEDEA